MGNPGLTDEQMTEAAINAVAARGENYGSPEDNFGRIACLWNAHLLNRPDPATELTDADVVMMMILMKIARLENHPGHMDSWIDIAGYAACGAEVAVAPI